MLEAATAAVDQLAEAVQLPNLAASHRMLEAAPAAVDQLSEAV
jgi:hypothetical protein